MIHYEKFCRLIAEQDIPKTIKGLYNACGVFKNLEVFKPPSIYEGLNIYGRLKLRAIKKGLRRLGYNYSIKEIKSYLKDEITRDKKFRETHDLSLLIKDYPALSIDKWDGSVDISKMKEKYSIWGIVAIYNLATGKIEKEKWGRLSDKVSSSARMNYEFYEEFFLRMMIQSPG